MDSVTSKKTTEEERQAEIRRQIVLLQAQLPVGEIDNSGSTGSENPTKRKRQDFSVLVPETPSKKKKRVEQTAPLKPAQGSRSKIALNNAVKGPPSFPIQKPQNIPPPTSSTVLQKLAQAHKQNSKTAPQEAIVRSNSFAARPPPIVSPSELETGDCSARDDNLALVEDLPIGPTEHKPPFDDPHFEKLEPNSGIRLLSRVFAHEDFQDYLRGRYYLSPSKLYSVVRLLPNKQGYDVPVCGDWLTIAVVAERGQMKFTQAPVGVSREDTVQRDDDRMDELPPLDVQPQAHAGPSRPFQRRQKPQEDGSKPVGKKYVNMKLIDFGCRSRGSSADGGKAKIRGDAYLSLLLFESDSFDVLKKEDGKEEKLYRGGSRGAFERMSKLREGAVVALLNPKILKPFQRSGDKPHPTENILALTPETDASIVIIGYTQDLGRCRAMKRDGTRCSSWCDKRVSDVCDFHIQNAVEHRRAARPEFSVGTSGMTTSAKKKPAYDPARQWGLKPETQASGGTTYVVSGHVISGSASQSVYIGETVGREAQAKAARKLAADSDKALQRLLSRDKEGTKALVSAREFAKRREEAAKDKGKKGKDKSRGKGKGKGKETSASQQSEGSGGDEKPKKNAYSAELIKQLGFDPTAKDGRPAKDANVQSKMNALAALQAKRKINLGPRPGKSLSCVRRPDGSSADDVHKSLPPPGHDEFEHTDDPDDSLKISDDDSDDELEKEEIAAFGRPLGLGEAMVDLDDSDGDS